MDNTDLLKMNVDTMRKHLTDFNSLAQKQPDDKTARRFLARGAFLRQLGDVLDSRLQKGWTYLLQHPDDDKASTLWFSLLDMYEQINAALEASPVDLTDAARKMLIDTSSSGLRPCRSENGP